MSGLDWQFWQSGSSFSVGQDIRTYSFIRPSPQPREQFSPPANKERRRHLTLTSSCSKDFLSHRRSRAPHLAPCHSHAHTQRSEPRSNHLPTQTQRRNQTRRRAGARRHQSAQRGRTSRSGLTGAGRRKRRILSRTREALWLVLLAIGDRIPVFLVSFFLCNAELARNVDIEYLEGKRWMSSYGEMRLNTLIGRWHAPAKPLSCRGGRVNHAPGCYLEHLV